jgi:hypothetical protein
MSDKIYAPIADLFAFHTRKGLTPDSPPISVSPDWLANKYREILGKFDIQDTLSWPANLPESYRVELLKARTGTGKRYKSLSGVLDKDTAQALEIKGIAYPLQIGDSYALTLHLGRPQKVGEDEVDIQRLKDLNPQNCFLPEFVQSDLGQTLLIRGFLADPHLDRQSLRSVADKCVKAFLNSEGPPLYQTGQLFGSPIFEYGNPKEPSP